MRAEPCLAAPPRLSFRTRELPEDALEGLALIDLLATRENVSSWVHEGCGLIGLGRALVIEAHGADRIETLRAAWRAVVGAAWWRDALVRPGTGPVALGAITFSPSSEQSSVLVVPEVLVGLDDSGAWLTTVVSGTDDGTEPEHPDPGSLLTALVADARAAVDREQAGADRDSGDSGGTTAVEAGALSEEQWCRAVCATQERMRAGQARKVVLARDVLAYPAAPLPTGTVLQHLARDYPSTWVFAVDQMVGASPELLLRLRDRRLMSRVLAGTARRHAGEDALATARLASWLEGSEKNNREHELARDSAITALEPLCSVVEAPARFVLTLPNVLHLASDVTGVVAGDTGALALRGRVVHRSAQCPAARGGPRTAVARESVRGRRHHAGLRAGR